MEEVRTDWSAPDRGSDVTAPDARIKTGGGEIRALTGLRIVAALWVVVLHYQGALTDAVGGYMAPFWPVISAGWLGVDLFFLLSGFVMTVSYLHRLGPRWDRRASVAFVWARLTRIWPLWALLTTIYFVFMLITGWDGGGVEAARRDVSVTSYLQQLGLVQMWHREQLLGSSFVVPGWSLSVEFLAYLVFPLVVLVLFRLRRLPAVVLAGLALGAVLPMAYLAYQDGLADGSLPWPLRISGAFLSGALTCMFVDRVKASAAVRKAAPGMTVFALVQIVLIAHWAFLRQLNGEPNPLGVAVLFFPVLVGALALSDRGPATFLSRDTMVLGGRISFALYLVHTVLLDFLHAAQPHFAVLAVGSPLWTIIQVQLVFVSVGLAYLLYRFVEEPSRLYLRHRGPGSVTGRRAGDSAARGATRPVAPSVANPTVMTAAVADPAAPVAAAAPRRRSPEPATAPMQLVPGGAAGPHPAHPGPTTRGTAIEVELLSV
jgi:peptidoglycan/LPS O-acetylase OafA/YrhL